MMGAEPGIAQGLGALVCQKDRVVHCIAQGHGRFLVTKTLPWAPVLLFQLPAPNEPQPRPQEADLPQAGVSQARGRAPGNGEPRTPAPSAEAVLDLKRQGEKGE